jgi:hypothetical protein
MEPNKVLKWIDLEIAIIIVTSKHQGLTKKLCMLVKGES